MARLWADWLRDQFTERGWSDSDAAEASDIPVELISEWITDGVQPSIDDARKLANALGLPVLTIIVAAGILTVDDISPVETDQPQLGAAERAVREGKIPSRFQINLHRDVTQDTPSSDEPDGA